MYDCRASVVAVSAFVGVVLQGVESPAARSVSGSTGLGLKGIRLRILEWFYCRKSEVFLQGFGSSEQAADAPKTPLSLLARYSLNVNNLKCHLTR